MWVELVTVAGRRRLVGLDSVHSIIELGGGVTQVVYRERDLCDDQATSPSYATLAGLLESHCMKITPLPPWHEPECPKRAFPPISGDKNFDCTLPF